MDRKSLCRALNLAVAMVGLTTASVASAATYTITDVGVFAGVTAPNSYGVALNNLGQVVGNARTATGYPHAFLYSDGQMTDLGSPGDGSGNGTASYAYGINDNGQVVLMSGHGKAYAFTYSASTGMTSLGGDDDVPLAINNSGQAAGHGRGPSGADACIFSGGSILHLGNMGGGGAVTQAMAINDLGWVTGFGYDASYTSVRSFLYSGAGLVDIGNLGGTSAYAYGLNNLGQVVGESNPSGSAAAHAFLYSGPAGMIDMGILDGYANSRACGINDGGQAVGYSRNNSSDSRAFIYSGSTMTDLNSLIDPTSGWSLTEADAINSHGQIAGTGTINGQVHGFLLTPTDTPEPASLGLLGLGGLALLLRRPRKST
jgi:probable HAF family extracellular repeat protein